MPLTKQQISNLDKAAHRRAIGSASAADLRNLAYAEENHGYVAVPRFVWPIDKVYITQGFGLNPQMYAKYGWKGHNGLDFRVRFVDSPLGRRYIVAVEGGVVGIARADARGYGTHVRVRHADGYMTIYGHLTKSYVSKGQKVKQGERIGLSGNTGDSTGAHLHFEYRPKGWEKNTKNGYGGAVNPTKLFPTL